MGTDQQKDDRIMQRLKLRDVRVLMAVAECRSMGKAAVQLAVSQPAISQHLAALKSAKLVSERRDGRHAYYRSDPRGLTPLAEWVQRYRVFWPPRIEKLKRVLKEMNQ